MDAENSLAAGLRNGLRSAAGLVQTPHATCCLTHTFACVSAWMHLTKLLPLRLSCSGAERSDSVGSLGILLRSKSFQSHGLNLRHQFVSLILACRMPFYTPRGQKCVRRVERREPPGPSFLSQQADACRSPTLSLMTAWGLCGTRLG